MQIEIYNMTVLNDKLNISLEAVCDSFSSLLWNIEYYKCGAFEVYIAASLRNIEIFQTGRIVGRDDDKEHFGLIESVELETDSEDGDYLIIKGRFLMCLLERRIIYPTLNFTTMITYGMIIQKAVENNALVSGNRLIPSLKLGEMQGACWSQTTKLQVSYENLMEWIYTICEKIGGTVNIRLSKIAEEQYEMIFDLLQGADRSMMQEENPHIVFSDSYNNLLSFTYFTDTSVKKNFAYGCYNARAIITSVGYDELRDMYELALLGVGSDGCSFTNPGNVRLDTSEKIRERMLENQVKIIASRYKLTVNGEEILKSDENYSS